MKRLLLAIPLGWLLTLPASPALADDSDPASPALADDSDQGWEFSFAPYIWGLSLDSEVSAGGTTTDLDVSLDTILRDLNFMFLGQFTARRGRWLAIFDGAYAELEDHETLDPRPIGFGPASVGDGRLEISIPRVQTSLGPTKVDVDLKIYKVKLAVGYRLLSQPLGELDDPRRMTLDVYAGGRFRYIDTDIEVRIPQSRIPGFTVDASLESLRFPGRSIDLGGVEVPGATLGGLDETYSSSQWWIDPLVGMRLNADLTERFELSAIGDVGGFSIGSASQFTWEAQGLLGYRVSDHWTLALGYRAIGIDRPKGSGALDGTVHGPILAAVFRWGAGRPPSGAAQSQP